MENLYIIINIHPTKTEIKFDNEQALYAILRSAVKHSLGQFNVAPVLDFDRDSNLDTPYHYKNMDGEFPTIQVDGNYNPFGDHKPNKDFSNTNYKKCWWFPKDDVSLVGDASPLSHQEVVQAILDGKELEMQYKTGTWVNVIPTNTTLHQLTNLNFRLKQSLEDKRKAVIKKLLESKVAVLCKCWDDDNSKGEDIVAITDINDDFVYSYMNRNCGYKNAYAIDDNGNEITNV